MNKRGENIKKVKPLKKMYTCVVRADSQEELRQLVEIKVAELLNTERRIIQTKALRVRQRDLFNWVGKLYYEVTIICEI